ncbi:LuxR C-terminal-related transcriptional regulator (plasmid) [Thioclava sp. 'Guangxiensis']|uniref:helix-turn-helix transcriptional regulator n=1 Tax=Thioclava sp. 'Guangxiensis' TaxID=3149044 RepID=UPI0032C471FC
MKSPQETVVSIMAEAVDCIGMPRFPEVLLRCLQAVIPFEFSVVFGYHDSHRPLDLFDNFPSRKRKVMVDDYQEGPYLLDPLFRAAQAPAQVGLVRLRDIAPDRFYQGEYFRNYYIQTGLAEEIGFIVDVGEKVTVVISAMRETKPFSAREFRDLEALYPFVRALTQRHWGNLISRFSHMPAQSDQHLPQLIDKAFKDFGRNNLTPREAEIVEYILKGFSSEATGRALGISTGTVRIHRRNIYAKLGVSSQGELFSAFITSMG